MLCISPSIMPFTLPLGQTLLSNVRPTTFLESAEVILLCFTMRHRGRRRLNGYVHIMISYWIGSPQGPQTGPVVLCTE